jgi:hypothetical protein
LRLNLIARISYCLPSGDRYLSIRVNRSPGNGPIGREFRAKRVKIHNGRAKEIVHILPSVSNRLNNGFRILPDLILDVEKGPVIRVRDSGIRIEFRKNKIETLEHLANDIAKILLGDPRLFNLRQGIRSLNGHKPSPFLCGRAGDQLRSPDLWLIA